MECLRREAAIAEGADGVAEATVEDDADAVAAAAAAAAATSAESAYEDDALMRQVEEVETPKSKPRRWIRGSNRDEREGGGLDATGVAVARDVRQGVADGESRSLFGPPDANFRQTRRIRRRRDASSTRPRGRRRRGGTRDRRERGRGTRERIVAKALAEMTPEERTAARAKASKGWSAISRRRLSRRVRTPLRTRVKSVPRRPLGRRNRRRDAFRRCSTAGPRRRATRRTRRCASSDPDSSPSNFSGQTPPSSRSRVASERARAPREPRRTWARP